MVDSLATDGEAKSHVSAAGPMEKDVGPLPPGFRVTRVQGGRERDRAGVIFFVDGGTSVNV